MPRRPPEPDPGEAATCSQCQQTFPTVQLFDSHLKSCKGAA